MAKDTYWDAKTWNFSATKCASAATVQVQPEVQVQPVATDSNLQ